MKMGYVGVWLSGIVLLACDDGAPQAPAEVEPRPDPCDECDEDEECRDDECVPARCMGWECGTDDSLDCGTCEADEYCTEKHQCEDACSVTECGVARGVDCGSCPGNELCERGRCEDPCGDTECGQRNGVECGRCSSEEYCSALGQCQLACQRRQCGVDNGVECGECEDSAYCNSSGQCVEACQNMSCGVDNGIMCGECESSAYCSSSGQCVEACQNMSCGIDNGIMCGECGEGRACDRGVCVAAQCDPSKTTFCDADSDAIYQCEGGVTATFLSSCPVWQHCAEAGGEAACVNDECSGLNAACIGSLLGTCNRRGSALDPAEPVTDCEELGLDCSRAGCGDVTVHDIALPPTERIDASMDFSGWVAGNFYEITTTTTLVELSPYLTLPDAELRWVIYRSDRREGPYYFDLIHSRYVGEKSGLISQSPHFNWVLEAGYYYFIGVEASQRVMPTVAHYTSDVSILELDFGIVLGGLVGPLDLGYEFKAPTGYLVSQQLTTVVLP